jgi:hypothetical protein
MMRDIVIEKLGRWDLALASASFTLVMLVLTGVLYSQHHQARASLVLGSNVLWFVCRSWEARRLEIVHAQRLKRL